MSEGHAAGRKTDHRGLEGRTEKQVEAQIGALGEHLAHVLAQARTIAPGDDPYGHARSGEIDAAVKLGKTTAKLVFALSKLKGEFNHKIHVTKAAAKAQKPQPAEEPPLITPEEWAADSVSNAELWRRCEERRKHRTSEASR